MKTLRFCSVVVVLGLVVAGRVAAESPVELSEKEKAQIQAAVRFREAVPAPSSNQPRNTPVRSRPTGTAQVTTSEGVAQRAPAAAMPERISRAINAHRELTQLLDHLATRREEIQRWDDLAQQKFQRAFGTVDEKVRQAVLQRIDQQMQESARALATLADSLRFEFYLTLNKK